jgi:hypothetical protein
VLQYKTEASFKQHEFDPRGKLTPRGELVPRETVHPFVHPFVHPRVEHSLLFRIMER